jgi:iron complex outermembrane receptor protein
MFAVCLLAAAVSAAAEDEQIEEVVVQGSLRSLPGENVESVFGFGKSLLETPRSASTISSDQLERFAIDDIDELIVLAPGTFTQSFFGVAGALDVRGTPGEIYFRGLRRLDNPGNYPTPIGASDRVDIVRGPATPIMGPSKIGGYLNFSPKSARAEGGQYMTEQEGAIGYTAGSWRKSVLTAEVGGPARIAGKDLGYYLYAEVEDSDSFYENTATDQTVVQASFDMDLNDRVRLQWGGMYHDFSGNQIAGWNRVTQDLIDNGTYITGDPFDIGLDVDGDGAISHQEHDINGDGFTGDLNPFAPAIVPGDPSTIDEVFAFGDLSLLALDPATVGTAQLRRDQVLVAPEDLLENESYTLYFDVIYEMDNGVEIKNQMFYDTYDNLNENAYGFSQFSESWVFEDRVVVSGVATGGDFVTNWQLSPSIRYTDFKRGQDYVNEYFDRRDLTGPYTPLSRRRLSTQIDDDYTEYNEGDYLNFGMAALVDVSHSSGLEGLFGVRWDYLDLNGSTPIDKLLLGTPFAFCTTFDPDACGVAPSASDTVDGWSWTASVSYGTDIGLRPYITASEQSTVVASQGADITANNIAAGGAFDTSQLLEGGIKGSFLDGRLYTAISFYRQERVDFSAQDIVTNQSTETEGMEFEARWAVNDQLLVTLGYSNIEVRNLTTEQGGGTFSFIGADDLPNVRGDQLFAGVLGGIVQLGNRDARRAGIPENIWSATATYDFGNGLAVNASIADVDSVPSGFSGSVTLPDYTLVNLGGVYETEKWLFSFTVNNATDEEYFRSNFPNLFGSAIVLPELPRNYSARVQYRF